MNMFLGLTAALAAATAQPYTFGQAMGLAVSGITIVIMALALLAVLVIVMTKLMPKPTPPALAPAPVAPAKPVAAPVVKVAVPAIPAGMTTLADNRSIGELDLHDVDDPTAAMIMAIVSDTTKIPLNQLYFRSIKAL